MELVTGVFGDERLPGKVGVRPASLVSSSLGGLGAESFAIRWALPAGYSYVIPAYLSEYSEMFSLVTGECGRARRGCEGHHRVVSATSSIARANSEDLVG